MDPTDETKLLADLGRTHDALDELARLFWPNGQIAPERSIADIRERALDALRWNAAMHGMPSAFVEPHA